MKRYLYILSLLMMSTVAFVSCSYDEWTDPVSTEVPEKSFIVKDTVKVKFTDGGAAVDIPVGRDDVSCEINGGFDFGQPAIRCGTLMTQRTILFHPNAHLSRNVNEGNVTPAIS